MKDSPIFAVVPPSTRFSADDVIARSVTPDGERMTTQGGFLVPQARSFSMIVNSSNRVYSYRYDEAMRDNFVQARAMRRDAFLRGLL